MVCISGVNPDSLPLGEDIALASVLKGHFMTRSPTKRRVAPAVLLLASLLLASRADAKVVASDDGMYSLDVDGQGAGHAPVGTVKMMTGPSHETVPPDAANADRVGEEAAALLAKSLPAGARVVPTSSKIAWGKNVPVVRTTVKVEGLPAGTEAEASAREVLTAVGGRHLYLTVWSGTAEQGAELARVADQAATTTDLKPEGRPFRPLNPWPGRLLFFFGIAGLILLRVRMKKNAKRKKA